MEDPVGPVLAPSSIETESEDDDTPPAPPAAPSASVIVMPATVKPASGHVMAVEKRRLEKAAQLRLF